MVPMSILRRVCPGQVRPANPLRVPGCHALRLSRAPAMTSYVVERHVAEELDI
jgi:hypothetical protein